MRELEYKFDSELLLRKKKKLKKILLDNKFLIEKKIAILSGSTINEVKDMLEIFLLGYGIKPIFYESDYNRYYEEAVFENDKLKKFNPDIIYIFTSFRNIQFDFDIRTDINIINEKLSDEYKKFESIWTNLKEKYNASIIQNNFEYPNFRLLGNKDISDFHGFSNFLNRLNMKFYEYANSTKNFFICDLNYISSMYGIKKWHNEKYYSLYKLPCDISAMPLIAFNISNIIKSIYGKNKKSIILDLDNTLWGNAISEVGLNGIEIGSETGKAESYLSFQKYIKKLKSLGIILNVASKNYENVALDGIENSDGVLKKEDFVNFKINYDSKDVNINEMAKELSLGTDSFVFIDDSPFEREIVERNVEGISVPKVSDVDSYIDLIDGAGFFEVTNISDEDLVKDKLYKEKVKIENLKKEYENYDDFLSSLEMNAEIKSFTEKYYERISQLTNKSNQFNLTTKRYSPIDIKNISENNNFITLYGKLSDKFGDNGIVSLFIGEKVNDVLNIDLFLMSCRVLKRDMEYAMMDEIVFKCKTLGIKKIYGYYYKTLKNDMVKDLYKDFGFTKISKDNEENTTWILNDLQNYINKNKHIKGTSKS